MSSTHTSLPFLSTPSQEGPFPLARYEAFCAHLLRYLQRLNEAIEQPQEPAFWVALARDCWAPVGFYEGLTLSSLDKETFLMSGRAAAPWVIRVFPPEDPRINAPQQGLAPDLLCQSLSRLLEFPPDPWPACLVVGNLFSWHLYPVEAMAPEGLPDSLQRFLVKQGGKALGQHEDFVKWVARKMKVRPAPVPEVSLYGSTHLLQKGADASWEKFLPLCRWLHQSFAPEWGDAHHEKAAQFWHELCYVLGVSSQGNGQAFRLRPHPLAFPGMLYVQAGGEQKAEKGEVDFPVAWQAVLAHVARTLLEVRGVEPRRQKIILVPEAAAPDFSATLPVFSQSLTGKEPGTKLSADVYLRQLWESVCWLDPTQMPLYTGQGPAGDGAWLSRILSALLRWEPLTPWVEADTWEGQLESSLQHALHAHLEKCSGKPFANWEGAAAWMASLPPRLRWRYLENFRCCMMAPGEGEASQALWAVLEYLVEPWMDDPETDQSFWEQIWPWLMRNVCLVDWEPQRLSYHPLIAWAAYSDRASSPETQQWLWEGLAQSQQSKALGNPMLSQLALTADIRALVRAPGDRYDPRRQRLQRLKSAYAKAFAAPTLLDLGEAPKDARKKEAMEAEIHALEQALAQGPEPIGFDRFLEWQWAFPGLVGADGQWEGFDWVGGLFPALSQARFPHLNPYLKERYKSFDAQGNLFVYFAEAGIRFLKPGAPFLFLLPKPWDRSATTQKFRTWMGTFTEYEQLPFRAQEKSPALFKFDHWLKGRRAAGRMDLDV